MFDGVGWGEIVVLLLVGLFVFGPDRLPKAARDAGRLLRQLRQMATGVREDIRAELGPEYADLDLRTLHPRAFVRKHLFEDEDPLFRSYLSGKSAFDRTLFGDLDEPPRLTKGDLTKEKDRGARSTTGTGLPARAASLSLLKGQGQSAAAVATTPADALPIGTPPPYDPDAT